jgi:hypothetical protein
VALMCFDPETFPTLSRARKACRKGTVLLSDQADPSKPYVRGRAADRVCVPTHKVEHLPPRTNLFLFARFARPPTPN